MSTRQTFSRTVTETCFNLKPFPDVTMAVPDFFLAALLLMPDSRGWVVPSRRFCKFPLQISQKLQIGLNGMFVYA